MNNDHLSRRLLQKRASQGALRRLRLPVPGRIDFYSNDYLGLARGNRLQAYLEAHYPGLPHGSAGSRLLGGNTALHEETEEVIAAFHGAEAALLFNSGYDANVGLFSSVPQKGDIIFYDELIHASVRDGLRLSLAESFSFRHNDLDDLARKAGNVLSRKGNTGEVFVAIESLYSMDGDIPPLRELAAYCRERGFHLIVDEAHAGGLFGGKGEGLMPALGLTEACFARVYTYGKAFGVHGAAIAGSGALREFLINFARPFIYSTALPPHAVAAIRSAYALLPELDAERERVKAHSRRLSALLPGKLGGAEESPIRTMLIPGNERARAAAESLQAQGFELRAILSPTVPKGSERIRICLHSFNTEEEVEGLAEGIKH